jgi:hypothetical protein
MRLVEYVIFLIAHIHATETIVASHAILAKIEIEGVMALSAEKTVRTRIYPETLVTILRFIRRQTIYAIFGIVYLDRISRILGISPVKAQITVFEAGEIIRIIAVDPVHDRQGEQGYLFIQIEQLLEERAGKIVIMAIFHCVPTIGKPGIIFKNYGLGFGGIH